MRKVSSIVLSTLTAAILVGCGGGSSSSSTETTGTDVTVERGAIFGATVTDANGQIAEQKDGQNVYTFATTPVYPITATGGYIDVDGDITTTDDTFDFTETLSSYSSVITPITDYLGDTSKPEGKVKLDKLKEISGVTDDKDLLSKVPSTVGKAELLALTNTIYLFTNDGDSSNDDFITNYETSSFKTKFEALKTEVASLSDIKEIAETLENKVMKEDLGKSNLSDDELNKKIEDTKTPSTLLKVADLGKFVSYDGGYWYDENTLSGDKLSFKAYDYKYVDENNANWVLENEDDYVTITKDSTNPYKFSYVDPITKEEGTFTILSTKKLSTYTDLYETKAKILVTKQATDINESDAYRWPYPATYPETPESQEWIAVTKLEDLVKRFNRSSFHIGDKIANTSSDGKLVDISYDLGTETSTEIGSWKIENDYLIAQTDTDIVYFRLVLVEDKYYIEQFEIDAVGQYEYETIYTGTNLDDFITDIKAAAPVITSDYTTVADENQTGLFLSSNTTEPFKVTVENNQTVTFSLTGEDAKSFNIDSNGVVTFKTAPDFETKPYYNFNVVATNRVGRESQPQNIQVKINDLDETVVTPTEPTTFTLTDEMISGKQLTFTDASDTVVANFFSNGTYYETFTNVESTTGDCYGTWSVNNGKLIINSKCSDSNSQNAETTSVTLNATPAVDVEGKAVEEDNRTTDVKITKVTNVSSDWLLVSNTIISTSDTKFEFGPYGHYLERATDNSYSCEGKWSYGNGKEVNVGCDNETGKSIVFPSYTPKVGDTITMKFDSVPETATITEISPF